MCQRKIYILDASDVDGGRCCGFIDHFRLGGRGGGGASARREETRQQIYYGTRKTKDIHSQNPLPFPTYLSN